MQFYVELTNLGQQWRLQKDDSFRKISRYEPIETTDFISYDPYEIIRLQKINDKIILDGKEWGLNPSGSSLDSPDVYYELFLKRDIFPLSPSKEQLISVIRNGDDRNHNSLILNINGFFELRNFHTINLQIEDPTIVLRNETFSAGNGYVGEEIIKRTDFIDELFASGLAAWLIHLKTGILEEYTDIAETKTEVEILKEIAKFKPEFDARLKSEEDE